MDAFQFNKEVKSLLKGYSVEYSKFANGDFGNLERIELEGFNKLATVEFWSEGWIGIDIYDCACDEQVMNILLSPEEKDLAPKAFEKLLDTLNRNS
ncbi:hypothetical protein SAMN04490207_3428 [Pseudomonas gessardii]|uniref:Uncharacterized protein n=1 Tax=Pseudomonas gessardii TaxID=78544 RepID=A0A7Y1MQI6_9PSED|nr:MULTISPECIES: hypothetical protein [Pseudomonas]MRU50170.1 hypothetical protein [Pseudomonas gessardii]NNA70106.1 hypothetical protein [Pseudomonas gessardii]NNA92600.1 hypothetical protein [Pseudomonas gessardii]NNA96522.1 hypothetical protein [Pseudomonas gessardii]ONH46076.1 hypothetical protein BLL38_07435 [Pseudomonas gessardii]